MNEFIKLKNSTVGIFGNGYIGGNLTDFLLTQKHKYNITIKTFDRTNLEKLKDIEFDYFFNCAGNTGGFRNDILNTIDSNLGLTSYLLKNIKIKKTYVGLSSTRVYGFSDDPNVQFEESFTPKHNHRSIDFIYDGTKLLLESLLIQHGHAKKANYCAARLSNVIGKFEYKKLNNDSTLFNYLLTQKTQSKIASVKQSLFSQKDYIFIDDAIEGILKIALNSNKSDIFNIASGNSVNLIDISKMISLDIESNDYSPISYSKISIQKAFKTINFKAKYNIKDLRIQDLIKNDEWNKKIQERGRR